MNRKQKKEQIRKLQNKCELIKQQSKKILRMQNKRFSEKESHYLEHIQILTKRLMDGQHYVTERICVNIPKESLRMYENSTLPLSVIEEYQEQQVTDMMLRELCKRTDLLQRTEHPDSTTFYMEVLKLDDRPIPTFAIPREYADNPFKEVENDRSYRMG